MTHIPKNIMVPIDFSAASDRALSSAKDLASRFDAGIHLLHVRAIVDDPAIDTKILDDVEEILAVSETKISRALELAGEDDRSRIHAHIKRGSAPADVVVAAVSEYNCDLVIMGTHGRRGLRGLFLGSVAKEVVHRSPIPVLTIRAEATGKSPPRRILVAYDSSEDSLRGVDLAAEWARLFSAEVTLLHAVEDPVYPDFYFDHPPGGQYLERSTQWSHEHLAKIANDHLSDVPHETAVIHAPVAKGIADFASMNDFDLVVLATRGLSGVTHGLFGSVAERVTQVAEVPVLTVRAQLPIPGDAPDLKSKSRARRRAPRVSKSAAIKRNRSESFSVERLPHTTVLRFHPRESLAGSDLSLVHGVWDFFEAEQRSPSRVLVIQVPPDLLGPRSLERLLGGPNANGHLTGSEVSDRILREENVIQRFIENVRGLNSFVVGVVDGEIAFQLAAPLLACDYRIVSSDSVFVNTTQTLPRAPLACLPWLLSRLVGVARASQLLLDVPRLSASDALELGLVNHVIAPDQLEIGALEVAERLGSLPRATLVSLKRAIIASCDDFQAYQQQELTLANQLAWANWDGE